MFKVGYYPNIVNKQKEGTLYIEYPTGSETFTGSDQITIRWNASNPWDGTTYPYGYNYFDLHYSINSGSTWVRITSGSQSSFLTTTGSLTSSYEYLWTLPNITSSQMTIAISTTIRDIPPGKYYSLPVSISVEVPFYTHTIPAVPGGYYAAITQVDSSSAIQVDDTTLAGWNADFTSGVRLAYNDDAGSDLAGTFSVIFFTSSYTGNAYINATPFSGTGEFMLHVFEYPNGLIETYRSESYSPSNLLGINGTFDTPMTMASGTLRSGSVETAVWYTESMRSRYGYVSHSQDIQGRLHVFTTGSSNPTPDGVMIYFPVKQGKVYEVGGIYNKSSSVYIGTGIGGFIAQPALEIILSGSNNALLTYPENASRSLWDNGFYGYFSYDTSDTTAYLSLTAFGATSSETVWDNVWVREAGVMNNTEVFSLILGGGPVDTSSLTLLSPVGGETYNANLGDIIPVSWSYA